MTKSELATILKMLSVNYSKTVDNALMSLWYDFFKDFELKIFQRACQKVMSTSDYFPKISEVMATYNEIQSQEQKERDEKEKANNRLLVQKQDDCFLCNNTGICTYRRGDYEYGTRCICTHGRDLNKFSKAQIYRDCVPEAKPNYSGRELAMIKDGKNPFYMPTIKEILGKDFDLFSAYKKAQRLEAANLKSDEDKFQMLQSLTNTIGEIR